MNRIRDFLRNAVIAVAVAAVTLVGVGDALADKLHLKDGRVLEGTVEREGDGFVYFKVKIGSIENVQFFTTEQILKIEREGDSKPSPAEETPATEAKKDAPAPASGATRVAILNFGPPSTWSEKCDSTVGIQISAKAWKDVIPMLEKDKVDVVVVRINSGGGLLAEMEPFNNLFENLYKRKFRTVAWVESAISCAAMSPYVLEEFYFMPEGNLGACTGWGGALVAVKGIQLEMVLYQMEQASAKGKRDPKIMRAMQIMEPLSADIDEATGEVTWRQDELGEHVLNPRGKILTLNANDAVRFGFARGIASTKEELAKAMGLQEVEWVGQKAAEYIDKNMLANDRTEREMGLQFNKYGLAIGAAQAEPDKTRRGLHISVARRHLNELRRMFAPNPNFGMMYGIDNEWFMQEEERLKELAK